MSCVYTSDELELLEFEVPSEEEIDQLTEKEFDVMLGSNTGNSAFAAINSFCYCNSGALPCSQGV